MGPEKATTLAALLGDALAEQIGIAALSRRAAYEFPILASRTREIAHGLLARGVAEGDLVATVAEPTPEALYVELAILSIGAVALIARPEQRSEARASARQARLTIAGDRAVFQAIGDGGEAYVIDDPAGRSGSPLDLLAARGIAWSASNAGALASRTAAVAAGAVATQVGTVATTQGAWAEVLVRAPRMVGTGERVLIHAPLDDPAARLLQYAALRAGGALCYAPPGSRIDAAAAQAEPAVIVTTPAALDEFAAGVSARLASASGLRRALSRHGAGLRHVGRGAVGRWLRTTITSAPPRPATVDILASVGIEVVTAGDDGTSARLDREDRVAEAPDRSL